MKRYNAFILVVALILHMTSKTIWTSILLMAASVVVIVESVANIRKEWRKGKNAKR